MAGEIGDLLHLALGGTLAGLVEVEQDRRVHPLVLLGRGADQRVRHIGFSMPSVSFSSSSTPASGAVKTTSARALPIAGFFQVPFTGSATSVA
ncbi:hypothetical protein [Streptomyces sp. NPDC001816]|uniref:hypothetical protein n=1 Tax=Streptomyces sp. NPDC001816 TaxID=3364612 RepID=UPI0036B079DC